MKYIKTRDALQAFYYLIAVEDQSVTTNAHYSII